MQKIRVMLADDHALIRDGLRILIGTEPDMEIIAEAKDGDEALCLAQEVKPDVVLLDVAMPKMASDRVLKSLSASHPEIKVIIVSAAISESLVQRMRALGAAGYVHKHIEFARLCGAIRRIAGGEKMFARSSISTCDAAFDATSKSNPDESGLNPRDIEIFKLIARGHTNKEIAQMMHLSVKSIEAYKTKVATKMGLRTRAEIVAYALKRGWLTE